ncbi:MAG TPA: hypothetical protein VH257_06475, partial [Chloroflexota bacterium]|nr:hypothetical protein [Chloroflexota bacterium]
HLRAPIKESARITPLQPLEFRYPLDPSGARGTARFSAFGTIDGKLVMSPRAQTMGLDEEAVFILASRDAIQLVSKDSVLGESDRLGRRLLNSALAQRPRFGLADAGSATTAGAGTREHESHRATPGTSGYPTGSGYLTGIAVAVDYSSDEQALVIQPDGGPLRRVLLRTGELAEALDERRRRVHVKLDESGRYAEQVRVEL